MTEKPWNQYRYRANSLRQEGRLLDAARTYTLAGFARLTRVQSEKPPYTRSESPHNYLFAGAKRGLVDFLYAGMCFRMAGDDLRRTFCCDLGILIAEYQLEAHDWSDFGKGGYDYWAGWWEYIALFRLVGGMEGSDQAFDTAEEIYVDYGDPEFIPEDFQVKYESFIISVAESAGYDIEEYALKFWAETHPPLESTTFTEWIDFLREHVPEFIEMVDQQGEWVDDVGPDSEETEEDS